MSLLENLSLPLNLTKTGSYKGMGSLYINETKVGETAIEKTLPYKLSFEGLDVGKDSKYPVSPGLCK